MSVFRIQPSAWGVCFAVFGCMGTETGNPGAAVTLAAVVRSSDEAKVSLDRADSTLHVDTALVSLKDLALHSCGDEAPPSVSEAIVDLTGSGGVRLALASPAGEACGVEYRVEPPAETTSRLGELSFVLEGTRSDGTPFVVRSQVEHAVALAGEAPLDASSLILGFDMAAWFDPAELDGAQLENGVVLIDGSVNGELLPDIEAGFVLSAELFVDTNGNGMLDTGESTPVAGSQ